ncbi:MAG: type IX secretion system membrane protein PorP/SprF [Cyclobacteriaceae bacterium]|nr:type IX secretion system membrane protein PorP/SprF [Cyclobacteriaceae bacterium]
MRKIIYACLFSLGFLNLAQAQQPPVNSLYMFDQLLINPAYAGAQVQFSATAVHRNQWANFPGAPKTSSFSTQTTVARNKVGIGLIFINDRIGVHNDNMIYMAYSYKLEMPVGELSLGIQGGMQMIKSDWDLLKTKDPDNTLAGITSNTNPNFGTGIFYSNRDFYAGLSVPYLLNSITTEPDLTLSEGNRERVYWMTVGNKRPMGKDFEIIPQALIRLQKGSPLSFDLNTHIVYKDAVGIGMSYRIIEGIVAMFELKLNENLHVGYAYDMTTSALQKYSNGTHEIMINYRYKIPALHKGLECPSYF